jgi:hypothetical protein
MQLKGVNNGPVTHNYVCAHRFGRFAIWGSDPDDVRYQQMLLYLTSDKSLTIYPTDN